MSEIRSIVVRTKMGVLQRLQYRKGIGDSEKCMKYQSGRIASLILEKQLLFTSFYKVEKEINIKSIY